MSILERSVTQPHYRLGSTRQAFSSFGTVCCRFRESSRLACLTLFFFLFPQLTIAQKIAFPPGQLELITDPPQGLLPVQAQPRRMFLPNNRDVLIIREPQLILRGGALVEDRVDQFDQPLKNAGFDIFEQRAQAFLIAQKSWVDRCCNLSEEQHLAFDDLVGKALANLHENRVKYHLDMRDVLPVTLSTQGIVDQRFNHSDWDKKIESLLSDDQQSLLLQERTKRQERLISAIADHCYCELTQTMHFTPAQEKPLKEHFQVYLKETGDSIFSTVAPKGIVDYRSTYKLLEHVPEELFSLPQQYQLKRIQSSRLPRIPGVQDHEFNIIQVTFPENGNEVSFHAELQKSFGKAKQKVEHVIQIHTDELIAILNLPESEARQLKLAQRGVAQYLVDDQKSSVEENARRTQQRMIDRGLGRAITMQLVLPNLNESKILSHPIYLEAVKKLGPRYEQYQQVFAEQRRSSQVSYLVSFLNRELWLTQSQSESLSELIDSRFAVQPGELAREIYEIVLVGFALNAIPKAEIEQILDEAQLAAWNALERQYNFHDESLASLKFPDGGTFPFNLPKQKSN